MIQRLREPVNGLTHLGGALAAAVGLAALLVLGRGSLGRQAALLVYGLSLVLMLSASAAYHLAPAGPRLLQVLRKLDHAAIYLLIAGTYTPICLHFFEGAWRWGMLITIWSMAAAGIGVKLFIVSAMPVPAIVWLLAGGLFFTVGALVYITRRPDPCPGVFGFHELWHIFVLLGCLSHYILIAAFVAAGGGAG
jgi:hemolysin III